MSPLSFSSTSLKITQMNMGSGKSDASILHPVKRRFFIFCLSLHHPINCFENISISLFAPLQLSSQKYWWGAFPPCTPMTQEIKPIE
jgi:hypothetical protein